MSDWNEENFLDKLNGLTEKNAGRERCPEAELLSTRARSESSDEIAEKIREHRQTCPICRDLEERLNQFDQQDVSGRDASAFAEERMDEEGAAAEERLDTWFNDFLSAHFPGAPGSGVTPAAKAVARPATEHGRFWEMRSVLAAAAVIAIASGAPYIWRWIRPPNPGPEVAHLGPYQPPPKPPDSSSAPTAVVSEKKPATPEIPKHADSPKSGNGIVNPKNEPASTGEPQTQAAEPDAVSHTKSAANPGAQTPSAAAKEPPIGTSPTRPPGERRPGIVGLAGSRNATAGTSGRSATPALIRFGKGTQFWMSLESREAQSGGRFQFTARLLLLSSPVPNGVVLEKGTVLSGVGEESDGQTALQITEFVFHGARYRLKSDAGEFGSLAWAGKAAMSQDGKGAEVKLESEAIFEYVERLTPTEDPTPP